MLLLRICLNRSPAMPGQPARWIKTYRSDQYCCKVSPERKNQLSLHGRVVLCLGGGAEPVRSFVVQAFRGLLTGNLIKISSATDESELRNLAAAFRKSELNSLLVGLTNGSQQIDLEDPDIRLAMYDGAEEVKAGYRRILCSPGRGPGRIGLILCRQRNADR